MNSPKVVALNDTEHTIPTSFKRTVPLRGKSTKPREYLTKDEIGQLIDQTKKGRYAHRDATMITMAFRHGLRVSELVDMRWSDVDFSTARLHVRRAKGSNDGVHILQGDEMRALKRLKRESTQSPFMFISERGAPVSTDGFRKAMNRWGIKCGFDWSISPHCLRHACGYHLANNNMDTRSLQEWLGHKDITNTVRYTKLAANRFDNTNFNW
ncbi:tyrosine-type recombinase/integrase [Thalassotalea nanhaiensis]|uniref:Tyrosine-type recombinase/integrase n=1 Tax=Thalassotalea nanhaiensis TaxID=3065648 RepID=A0ABY9TMG8_9GAMM|nr:tyrosine-type recombinase/integrase [Colwelliaceae bacterium SQ345]